MMNVMFAKPKKSDYAQLKNLWQNVFCEKQEAVDLIFDRYFDIFDAYCAKQGELIVAAVYLAGGSVDGQRANYLCGAATLPEYRRQGIMSALIEYALMNASKNGDKFSLLFPANDGLYSYYQGLGYTPLCGVKRKRLSRKQLEGIELCDKGFDKKCDYEQIQKNCFGGGFLLQSNRFVEFAAEYYTAYGVKFAGGRNCFALIDEENGCADVICCAYNSFEDLKILLLDSTAAEAFDFVLKSDNPLCADMTAERFGMIKPLADIRANDDIFIGITLN